jgi:ABC-type Zn uptake system ZnuABC Zn-binding protein ZnuA
MTSATEKIRYQLVIKPDFEKKREPEYFKTKKEVMKAIKEVDASMYEGEGMTGFEAKVTKRAKHGWKYGNMETFTGYRKDI